MSEPFPCWRWRCRNCKGLHSQFYMGTGPQPQTPEKACSVCKCDEWVIVIPRAEGVQHIVEPVKH